MKTTTFKTNVFFKTENKIDIYRNQGQFTFWKGRTFHRCDTYEKALSIINSDTPTKLWGWEYVESL